MKHWRNNNARVILNIIEGPKRARRSPLDCFVASLLAMTVALYRVVERKYFTHEQWI